MIRGVRNLTPHGYKILTIDSTKDHITKSQIPITHICFTIFHLNLRSALQIKHVVFHMHVL